MSLFRSATHAVGCLAMMIRGSLNRWKLPSEVAEVAAPEDIYRLFY
jgi:hypothetical protein